MMPGTAGGSAPVDPAKAFYNSVAQVAADPEGYKIRLAALDEATARSEKAAADALEEQNHAKEVIAEAQKRLTAAGQARQEADDFAKAATGDVARAKAAAARELDARTAALDEREKHLLELSATLDSTKADLDKAVAANADLIEKVKEAAAQNAELKTVLDRSIATANAREAAANAAIAEMKAVLGRVPR